MKYSKKQIEKAYAKWETEVRLNPTGFLTESEIREENVEEIAKKHTETLLTYLNN